MVTCYLLLYLFFMPSTTRKVLLLHASIGNGHLRASLAVQEELQRQRPDWKIMTIDSLDYISKLVEGIYKDWYSFAIRRAPVAWKYIYKETEDFRKFQQMVFKPRIVLEEMNAWKLERLIKKFGPDVIVNTHHLPLSLLSYWKKHHKFESARNLAVLTDYCGHRFWVHPTVERYYVATEEVGAYVNSQGVSPAIIKPFGIPISSHFSRKFDRPKLRAEHRLSLHQPTVLMIVDGIEKVFLNKMVRQLQQMELSLQGFVISGSPKVRAYLEDSLKNSPHRLRIIDRVPNIEEYYALADVLVSKSGGLTIAETLAMGLPLIIVNPIMGQEENNRNFLLEQGAALNVEIPDLLNYKLTMFFRDQKKAALLKENITRLSRPQAAQAVVQDIINLI